MKRLVFYFALAILCAFSAQVMANITTGSWYMDQSNAFSDGIDYGQVYISADASTGVVSFQVDAFVLGIYGTLPNFGMDKFGFNYTNITNPDDFVFSNLPTGWASEGEGNMDGFGRFLERVVTPSSRVDALTFNIQLKAGDWTEAVASNFAVLSTGTAGEGNVFFSAHVAGFASDMIGEDDKKIESHYIGGSAVIPAPGAVLLGSIGVGLVGWLRRRRTL